MRKLMFILGFFCCFGMCIGQQVVSSGGYTIKSDFSVNWILGGSLSVVDQTALDKNRQEQTVSEVSIKVYPVPVTDFLNIEISDLSSGMYILKVSQPSVSDQLPGVQKLMKF